MIYFLSDLQKLFQITVSAYRTSQDDRPMISDHLSARSCAYVSGMLTNGLSCGEIHHFLLAKFESTGNLKSKP